MRMRTLGGTNAYKLAGRLFDRSDRLSTRRHLSDTTSTVTTRIIIVILLLIVILLSMMMMMMIMMRKSIILLLNNNCRYKLFADSFVA